MSKLDNSIVVSSLAGNQREVENAECRALMQRAVRDRVSVDSLSANPNNPREVVDTSGLKESIERNGYDPSYPIVADRNGCIYRGHRRHRAILDIREDSPDTFDSLFPDGCIDILVIDGMSDIEAALLLYDHGENNDRVGLTEWEMLSPVAEFIRLGIATQQGIADHFGKSRSWAQQLVALCKMPKYVRESFKPVLLNDREKLKETKLRKMDILLVARDYVGLNASEFKTVWTTWVDGTHPDGQYAKSVKAGKAGNSETFDYSEYRESRNIPGNPDTLVALLETAETVATFKSALLKMTAELEAAKKRLETVESVLTAKQRERILVA